MKLFFFFFTIIVFTITLIQACTFYKKDSKITLLNNGYENVVIAIDTQIKEDYEIIERIKNVFTEASSFLFNSTRKRAYFKKITILIPNTWKRTYYNTVPIDYSSWETYDNADICVDKDDVPKSLTPFVVKYAGDCGEATALHMHLTVDYLINAKKSTHFNGPYKNVLVQQWAQYRYGVFDEFTTDDDESEFYYNSNDELDATRCSLNNRGKLRDALAYDGTCVNFLPTGLPDSNCVFEDDLIDNGNENPIASSVGSLMYKTIMPHINSFCDNDPTNSNTFHNSFAPNLHNRICKGKSVWEVLDEHQDFSQGKSQPDKHLKSTVPDFTILKQHEKRTVLIIDRTLIYESPNSHLIIKRSLEDFVRLMLKPDEIIGIIHFDVKSNIVMEFTKYSDESIEFINENTVPTIATTSKSNFWSALRLGVIMVKNSKDYPDDGANFILLTNAQVDLRYPNRKEVYELLKLHHITVDTIGFSTEADFNLELLAAHTGGLSFRLSDAYKIYDLTSALKRITNREAGFSKQFIMVHNENDVIQPIMSNSTFVYIDKEISNRQHAITRFQFEFDYLQSPANIKLIEPNTNRTYSLQESDECEQKFLVTNNKATGEVVCTFRYPLSGLWTVVLTNPYFEPLNSHFTVISYIEHETVAGNKEPVIKIEATWKKQVISYPSIQTLCVSVTKASRPILNANVQAFILKPMDETVSLDLFDDGLFSDMFKNDGIYCRHFASYNANGPYTAHITVLTNDDTVIHTKKIAGTHFPKTMHPTLKIFNLVNDAAVEPIHPFQRSISAGSFLLQNYIPNYDFIAPGCIKDFKVESSNLNDFIFVFSFTAPGDDADSGKAAFYDIKIMTNPIALLYHENSDYKIPKNFEIPTSTLQSVYIVSSTFSKTSQLEPNEYGTKERFAIKFVKNQNEGFSESFSIKLRAIDKDGNKGEWSQVRTIKLTERLKLAKGVKIYTDKNMGKKLALLGKPDEFAPKRQRQMLISFISILVILLVIAIVLVLLIFRYLAASKRSSSSSSSSRSSGSSGSGSSGSGSSRSSSACSSDENIAIVSENEQEEPVYHERV